MIVWSRVVVAAFARTRELLGVEFPGRPAFWRMRLRVGFCVTGRFCGARTSRARSGTLVQSITKHGLFKGYENIHELEAT